MPFVDLYRFALFTSEKFHIFNVTSFFLFFQIKQLWGHEVTVSGHHGTWEHKNIPWLWPENKPLPKKFRGEIHEPHLNELLKTDWTREKVKNESFFEFKFLTINFIF